MNWTPDVLHPVFYGYQDVGVAEGARGPMRIWYPTYEGFVAGPPILKLCLVRWPVVLFLHGQPPCTSVNYHHRWALLPAMLARSGYVVVVPSHSADFPGEPSSPAITDALAAVDWVRSDWAESNWVDKRPEGTAVAGHSYGALLAARVAAARPTIAAYVGLSGPWLELGNPLPVLQAIGAPSFFMWGTQDALRSTFESLDGGGLWEGIAAPKHAGVFPGEHFDYLRQWSGCQFPHGSCPHFDGAAAELVTLFIARRVPVLLSTATIPVDLDPPSVSLTSEQMFFAGGHHLNALKTMATASGCRIDLRWVEGAGSGSRRIGP